MAFIGFMLIIMLFASLVNLLMNKIDNYEIKEDMNDKPLYISYNVYLNKEKNYDQCMASFMDYSYFCFMRSISYGISCSSKK